MAKFKQVPQSFMFRKLVKYCRNMVKNFDSDCRDNDFFDVVRNCFDHDKAVELIEAAYSPKELEEMSKAKSRSCRLTSPTLWTRGSARSGTPPAAAASAAPCSRLSSRAWSPTARTARAT